MSERALRATSSLRVALSDAVRDLVTARFYVSGYAHLAELAPEVNKALRIVERLNDRARELIRECVDSDD